MTDTRILGITIPGHLKAVTLYALTSVCLILGGECLEIKQTDWTAMFWMNKVGWWLTQIGAVLNTVKAFYSNSTPSSTPPTPPVPTPNPPPTS